jgi:hypothetical protein
MRWLACQQCLCVFIKLICGKSAWEKSMGSRDVVVRATLEDRHLRRRLSTSSAGWRLGDERTIKARR